MDPGRQAMIERSHDQDRDITAPRRDANTRITKPSRLTKSTRSGAATTAATKARNFDPNYEGEPVDPEQLAHQEDQFALKQAKTRADIRVREARAKPIDYLAFNLRFIDPSHDVLDDEEGDIDFDIPSPGAVLDDLNEAALAELEQDITSPFYKLETNEQNLDYWASLLTLCRDRRQKLRKHGGEGRAVSYVSSDIDKILAPKTYHQLGGLEKQIHAKLKSNEPIDTDYWEQLLQNLLIYKAKAKLGMIYDVIKHRRVELLRDCDPQKAATLQGLSKSKPSSSDARRTAKSAQSSAAASLSLTSSSNAMVPASEPSIPPGTARFSASEVPTSEPSIPPGTARFSTSDSDDFSQATRALYEREVARGIGENEEIFTAEAVVAGASKPLWAGKYRPRKPRYFNRVQMGYEWNKYNQTHYDHENPPPRVVQGYKFNIFYPDLIDKVKAPTFKIIREGGRRRGESFAPAGEEDACLIRFTAGPPYEDIAFRIVDREWDYSAKKDRGFRSTFEKGILQLHFQFKKIYYRK